MPTDEPTSAPVRARSPAQRRATRPPPQRLEELRLQLVQRRGRRSTFHHSTSCAMYAIVN